MTAKGNLLVFDTSAAHCAAAFIRAGGRIVAARLEPMMEGQAERLVPLLTEVLAEAGAGWADLSGIGVGVGPGNFTGIRISVAAARGLGLALKCPVAGISSFEMLLDAQAPESEGPLLLTLAAPRGQIYLQAFERGAALGAPELIDPEAPEIALLPQGARLRGQGAAALGARLGLEAEERSFDDLLPRLAARAVFVFAQGQTAGRPAPLYVRPADAAPPSDPPPVILDA